MLGNMSFCLWHGFCALKAARRSPIGDLKRTVQLDVKGKTVSATVSFHGETESGRFWVSGVPLKSSEEAQ